MRDKKYYVPPVPLHRGAPIQNPVSSTKKRDDMIKRVREAIPDTPPLEHVDGEVVTDERKDVNYWHRVYFQVAQTEFNKFASEYPKRLERPYNTWLYYILFLANNHGPTINKKDPEMVEGAWKAHCQFIFLVGAFPTLENFFIFTGFDKDDFRLLPDPFSVMLRQKFLKTCEYAMVEQVASSPYTSINKIFLLKSIYGYVEASHNFDNNSTDSHKAIDDIPQFSMIEKKDN